MTAPKLILLCAHCGEPIEGEPLVKNRRAYCGGACALEAYRDDSCGPDCHCRLAEKPPIR